MAVEIIMGLVNKTIFGSRQFLFRQLMNLVNSSAWQTQKLGLQNITILLDSTISDDDFVVDHLKESVKFIGDKNFNEHVTNCLLKATHLISNFDEELISNLGNFIIDANLTDDYVKTSAVEFIPKLLQIVVIKNTESTTSVINLALGYLTSVIEDLKVNDAYKMIEIDSLKMFVPNGCIKYKFAAITALSDIITLQHPDIDVIKIIHLLTSVIGISKVNINFRTLAVRNVVSSVKKLARNKVDEISYETYLSMLQELKVLGSHDCLWSKGITPMLDLTDFMSTDRAYRLKKELFNELFILIQNSKQNSGYNVEASSCMILLLKSYKNEDVWENFNDVFNELVNVVRSDQLEDQRKNVFVYEIPKYIEFIISKFKAQKIDVIHAQVETVFTLFTELIKSETTHCNLKSAIVIATEVIVQHFEANCLMDEMSEPTLELVMEMYNQLTESNDNVALYAICNGLTKLIGTVILLQNSLFINAIYTLFCESLKEPNKFTTPALLNIVSIVKVFLPVVNDKLTIVKETFSNLKNVIIDGSNNNSRALRGIAELIEISPPEIKADLAYDICILCLNSYKNGNKSLAALKCIVKSIEHVSQKFQSKLVNDLLALLVEIISEEEVPWNESACVKYTAVDGIPNIISLLPEIEKHTQALIVYNLLISVFEVESENINSRFQKTTFLKAISKTVIFINLNIVGDLMKCYFANIREAVMEGLLEKFKSEDLKINFRHIIDILKFSSLSKGQGKYEKQLYEVATKKLEKIIEEIDEEGIFWVKENFVNMPSVIETKRVLKGLYHKVLSTINDKNEISDANKEFIVKCIEYGFTTTIKRKLEKEKVRYFTYELIFENISYTINNASEFDLKSVVDAALKQNNILAKQYQKYVPIFKNNGNCGLQIAATDFVIKSLVDDDTVLNIESWQLSLLHLSDQNKSEPISAFALIEMRNQFGYFLIYKVHFVDGKMWVTPHELHPIEINNDFRVQIFGEMRYNWMQSKKPRYYISSVKSLPSKEHQQLINMIKDSKELKSGDILYPYFKHLLDIPWSEYKNKENVKEYRKASLLKLDNVACDIARRDSQAIDYFLEIKLLRIEQTDLQNKIQSLKTQLNASDANSQEDKVKIQKQLDSLKKQYSVQEQRVKDITNNMLKMEYEGELTAEKIFLLEQQQDVKSNEMPQLNEPSVNSYADDDYLDLC